MIYQIKKVEKDGLGFAIGSRAHLNDDSKVRRTFLRTVLMVGFHILVKFIVGVKVNVGNIYIG